MSQILTLLLLIHTSLCLSRYLYTSLDTRNASFMLTNQIFLCAHSWVVWSIYILNRIDLLLLQPFLGRASSMSII